MRANRDGRARTRFAFIGAYSRGLNGLGFGVRRGSLGLANFW